MGVHTVVGTKHCLSIPPPSLLSSACLTHLFSLGRKVKQLLVNWLCVCPSHSSHPSIATPVGNEVIKQNRQRLLHVQPLFQEYHADNGRLVRHCCYCCGTNAAANCCCSSLLSYIVSLRWLHSMWHLTSCQSAVSSHTGFVVASSFWVFSLILKEAPFFIPLLCVDLDLTL